MRILLVVALLFVSNVCMADTLVGERVSDTAVRITRTSVNVVKVSDLVKIKKEIILRKDRIDAHYANQTAQLNNALLDVETQIQKAKDVGVSVAN